MAKFSGNELLQLAVQIEENGKTFYEKCLKKKCVDEEITSIFDYLAREELEHKTTFQKIAQGFSISVSKYHQQAESYLEALVNSRLFTDEDAAIKKVGEANNAQDLLRFALAFEKDTILFFYELLELTEDEARNAIMRMIAEEKEHAKHIARMLGDSYCNV